MQSFNAKESSKAAKVEFRLHTLYVRHEWFITKDVKTASIYILFKVNIQSDRETK